MIVMKFGGTSVQDAEAIRRVVEIVRGRLPEHPVMVVSAMAKVTRKLTHLAEEAQARHTEQVEVEMEAVRSFHEAVVRELLEGKHLSQTLESVKEICEDLHAFVRGICLIGELSPRSRARILSAGELLSSLIVYAVMNQEGIRCHWVDARKMIVTDDNYMSAKPLLDKTEPKVLESIRQAAQGAEMVLTQGFIASAANGFTSVLGFEGSDYTATLLGWALEAERVEIWTDVDGLRTADPRTVSKTKRIHEISYEVAAEMAFLGARVLHPMTIYPARSKKIPIYVLNSMNPTSKGTAVMEGEMVEDGPKTISFKKEMDYVEIGMKGFARLEELYAHVFGILNRYRVSTSLIASSESGLTLTLESGQSGWQEASEKLSETTAFLVERGLGQVSVIGKNILGCCDVIDHISDAASHIRMYTVGASRMSMNIVVDSNEVDRIVGQLHLILFG